MPVLCSAPAAVPVTVAKPPSHPVAATHDMFSLRAVHQPQVPPQAPATAHSVLFHSMPGQPVAAQHHKTLSAPNPFDDAFDTAFPTSVAAVKPPATPSRRSSDFNSSSGFPPKASPPHTPFDDEPAHVSQFHSAPGFAVPAFAASMPAVEFDPFGASQPQSQLPPSVPTPAPAPAPAVQYDLFGAPIPLTSSAGAAVPASSAAVAEFDPFGLTAVVPSSVSASAAATTPAKVPTSSKSNVTDSPALLFADTPQQSSKSPAKPKVKADAAKPPPSVPTTVPDNIWICAKCTYHNSLDVFPCSMCGSDEIFVASPAATPSASASASKQKGTTPTRRDSKSSSTPVKGSASAAAAATAASSPQPSAPPATIGLAPPSLAKVGGKNVIVDSSKALMTPILQRVKTGRWSRAWQPAFLVLHDAKLTLYKSEAEYQRVRGDDVMEWSACSDE